MSKPIKSHSKLSTLISRLKESSIKAAKKRERLPQPLFWSLFHSELSKIRRHKQKLKAMRIFLGLDTS